MTKGQRLWRPRQCERGELVLHLLSVRMNELCLRQSRSHDGALRGRVASGSQPKHNRSYNNPLFLEIHELRSLLRLLAQYIRVNTAAGRA